MDAVILAGGKGTRLQPLTDEIPKPLVKIGAQPIVQILLKRMQRCGLKRAHLAVGHQAERIRLTLGDGSHLGLEIRYSEETSPLSTVAPIKRIADLPDDFLVANGDILTDLDFRNMYEFHLQNKAKLTVAIQRRTNHVDYGVLDVDHEGQVTGFKEKPSYHLTVSMGIYVFSRSVLELVPDDRPFGFDDLMYLMLSRQEPVMTFAYDGYWLDIGRIEDYEQAQRDIKDLSD